MLPRFVPPPPAAAAATAATAPALAITVVASGTSCRDHLLEPRQTASVRSMRVPGAQLAVHRDLALVGLRRELGRQRAGRSATAATTDATPIADHDRPVRQRQVQEPAVPVVHAVEDRARSTCTERPPRPLRWSRGGGSTSSFEQSTGTSVTATNSDISSEKMTTTESCRNMMLEMPVRKSSGTNTAMCVRIDARIADQTSSLPSIGGGHAILAVSPCGGTSSRARRSPRRRSCRCRARDRRTSSCSAYSRRNRAARRCRRPKSESTCRR